MYIAKKFDQIDQKLAKFLNKDQDRDRLNMLFIREADGVYRFGTKRIYMKLGCNNQLLVRVGGGFMSIEDFMDQYQDLEVDRICRKDAFSSF